MKQIKLATLDDSSVGVGTMRISAAHAAAGSDSAELSGARPRGYARRHRRGLLAPHETEVRPAAAAWRAEGAQMANGADRPVGIAFISDGPDLADMYVLKLELDGYAVTVLTTEQAESAPHRMRAADILYLDVGSLSAAALVMHRTLRQRRDTKNVPIVLLAVRRAKQALSTALHLTVHDFLISSDTSGAERSAGVRFV